MTLSKDTLGALKLAPSKALYQRAAVDFAVRHMSKASIEVSEILNKKDVPSLTVNFDASNVCKQEVCDLMASVMCMFIFGNKQPDYGIATKCRLWVANRSKSPETVR